MSDWEGPSTTTVMPPASGGTPPMAPPTSGAPMPKGGAPLWALIVLVLAAALVAGTAVYLVAGGADARLTAQIAELRATNADLEKRVSELDAQIKSAEASSAAAAAAAAAGTPTSAGTTAATTTKQFTFITKVSGSSSAGYKLVADYAQMLTGSAANAAATAHGDESPPPNDYYIVNDNKKLRTFTLSKTAQIIVLGWAGADATAKKTLTIAQFMTVMPGGSSPEDRWRTAPYTITITGTTVTKVEQFYLP